MPMECLLWSGLIVSKLGSGEIFREGGVIQRITVVSDILEVREGQSSNRARVGVTGSSSVCILWT